MEIFNLLRESLERNTIAWDKLTRVLISRKPIEKESLQAPKVVKYQLVQMEES